MIKGTNGKLGKLQNALKDKGVCVALTWQQSSQTNDLRKKLVLDYDDDDDNDNDDVGQVRDRGAGQRLVRHGRR